MLGKKYFFLLLMLTTIVSKAQENLVLNPGFEDVNLDNLLCTIYPLGPEFENAVNYWSYPNWGTSDIYHTSLSPSCITHPLSTNTIVLSSHLPHTGNSMAGFIMSIPDVTYREYLQGTLSASLEIGSVYEVQFYVLKSASTAMSINNFGIKFLDAPMLQNSSELIDIVPDVNYSGTPVTESENWQLLSFEFTPTENNLNRFVLGNFFTNENSQISYLFIPGVMTNNYAYYFIDDVSVRFLRHTDSADFEQIGPFCEGEDFELPTTSVNGISGSWSPAINTTQTTTYTFTPDEVIYLPVQMTVEITPKTIPVFDSFMPLCFNDQNFVLPTISLNGISGNWSPSFDSEKTTTYIFTPFEGQCATQQSVEVVVWDDFDFNFMYFCESGQLYLEVVDNPSFISNASIFEWKVNGTKINENNRMLNLSSFINTSNHQLAVEVTVTNENGCHKKKNIEIAADNFCMIPKGISPNGDGLNDFLSLEHFNVENLAIYNRYGEIVYEKRDYTNEWNGQSKNGKRLPTATYYYHITTKKGERFTGWIYLLQEVN